MLKMMLGIQSFPLPGNDFFESRLRRILFPLPRRHGLVAMAKQPQRCLISLLGFSSFDLSTDFRWYLKNRSRDLGQHPTIGRRYIYQRQQH